jgi:RNA polymerase sigma factor (sigma-70 family)
MNENELIKGCLKNNSESQKALYESYYKQMLGICLRYSKNADEAKEMVSFGFLNIFNSIKNYKSTEPFDAWMKNNMIQSSIEFLSKNKGNLIVSTVHANSAKPSASGDDVIAESELAFIDKEMMLKAIQGLAPAYRKVFNLNVIDGFPHKKIAEILDIGEETSESTVVKAKYYLRKNIKQLITTADGN